MNLLEYIDMAGPVALATSGPAAVFNQVHAAGGMGLVVQEHDLLTALLQGLDTGGVLADEAAFSVPVG